MAKESAQFVREFAWSFPETNDTAFVLRAEGKPVGWLRFAREEGALSTAEWEGCRWTLERRGLFHPSVTVRSEQSDEAEAVFTSSPVGGGTVTFSSGDRYTWTREHFWSTTRCFRPQDNSSAVCLSLESSPLTAGGKVTACAGAAPSDTPILVLLAWYLRLLEFGRLSESIFVCG
jgi:hypothetical protein